MCAAISISGEKRVVQTALTGRRGTVNELVNVDSYKVSITAALIGEDGNYPEQAVQQMREMGIERGRHAHFRPYRLGSGPG